MKRNAGRHLAFRRQTHIERMRAVVLGANDGIVSTASLLVGVAAASATHGSILTTGSASLIAGAMSMAVGEYVSVHTQTDSEAAARVRAGQEFALEEAAGVSPLRAAAASAASFAIGAALPLLVAIFTKHSYLIPTVSIASAVFLALLGALAAMAGNSPIWPAVRRVTFWGVVAMAVTAAAGSFFRKLS